MLFYKYVFSSLDQLMTRDFTNNVDTAVNFYKRSCTYLFFDGRL